MLNFVKKKWLIMKLRLHLAAAVYCFRKELELCGTGNHKQWEVYDKRFETHMAALHKFEYQYRELTHSK